jgi:23S rRNA maturation-related 3'-5' exoribonuclease YhaM
MSFKPDDMDHETYMEELAEENNNLLRALLIILSKLDDDEPFTILEDARQIEC